MLVLPIFSGKCAFVILEILFFCVLSAEYALVSHEVPFPCLGTGDRILALNVFVDWMDALFKATRDLSLTLRLGKSEDGCCRRINSEFQNSEG